MELGPNKAIAAGLSGAATILIVWVLGLFHIQVPAEVASAFTMLIGTAATWLVPHGGS